MRRKPNKQHSDPAAPPRPREPPDVPARQRSAPSPQALDWHGDPIPGLYTAGEISSVFKFTYQAGSNLTECIVCGRVAGQNVAAEES